MARWRRSEEVLSFHISRAKPSAPTKARHSHQRHDHLLRVRLRRRAIGLVSAARFEGVDFNI